MLSLECHDCDGRCCTSKKRDLQVVLLPLEEDRFKDFSTRFQTPYGNLTVLRKSEEGNCIFYDHQKNLCTSYQYRPFECRSYPLQMYFDFATQQVVFGLDSMVCHKNDECSPEETERIKQEWIKQHLPLSWIKSYSTFDNPSTRVPATALIK